MKWRVIFLPTFVICVVLISTLGWHTPWFPLYVTKGSFRSTLEPTTSHYQNEALEPLTIRANEGRLGNQMCSLASLYGLAKLNHRNISIMPSNYEELSDYFDLPFPQVDKSTFVRKQPWRIGQWLNPEDYHIPRNSNIITGNPYPNSYTFFHHVRNDIRKLFQFKQPIKEFAQERLRHVKMLRPWTQHYVGVHVRRTDYLKKSKGGWLRGFEGREVDIEFFQEAVGHFRERYDNVTFLAVSDDRKWCREKLSEVGILTTPESPGPGHDLAFLAECNHTIMTYGTYGFWGGYLSGGEVVYFTDFLRPNSTENDFFVYEKMYPPEWVGISTTKPGYWESWTNPFLT